jgi:hypothetical protein
MFKYVKFVVGYFALLFVMWLIKVVAVLKGYTIDQAEMWSYLPMLVLFLWVLWDTFGPRRPKPKPEPEPKFVQEYLKAQADKAALDAKAVENDGSASPS